MTTKIEDPDTIRIKKELANMKPKEKCERAVASSVMIHNLEFKYKQGVGLSDIEIELIKRLNREVDIIMKDPIVRQIFEDEVKQGGTPVIWSPG